MLKRFLLSGAALTAFVSLAAAQSAPAPADPAAPPAAEAPASPSAAPGMAVDPSVKADPNLFSNIKGASVIGENDESVGSVSDILLGANGDLKALVIGHGGIVGIGKTYRQYEVSALPELVDGKVKIGELNTAALEGVPEYEYPTAETGRAATSDAAPPADGSAAPVPDAAAPLGSELWPASYIVGAALGAAEDKASISDLRFDGNKVAGVLIDKGSLGLGNKVQEVAFSDLEITGSPAEPQIALKSGAASADPATNPNAESSSVPGAAPAPAP